MHRDASLGEAHFRGTNVSISFTSAKVEAVDGSPGQVNEHTAMYIVPHSMGINAEGQSSKLAPVPMANRWPSSPRKRMRYVAPASGIRSGPKRAVARPPSSST